MSKQHKTSIGGQAVIEGIMMRGPEKTSLAVRLPNGSLDVETWENPKITAWYKKRHLSAEYLILWIPCAWGTSA